MAASLRRLNWLVVHDGTDALRVETINGRARETLVRDCHSLVAEGRVFSFMRTASPKREHTLRGSLRNVLVGSAFEIYSFASAGSVLQCPEMGVMLDRYRADSTTLVSSWVSQTAARQLPGLLFAAMVTKSAPPVLPDDREALVAMIETLQRERDEYKRKYEAVAEQLCMGLFH